MILNPSSPTKILHTVDVDLEPAAFASVRDAQQPLFEPLSWKGQTLDKVSNVSVVDEEHTDPHTLTRFFSSDPRQ